MKKQCKLLFEVEYDENEVIKETVWATNLGKNEYCVDNIPFYIKSVALGDIFSATIKDDFLYGDDLIKPSGNSTIRILFDDVSLVQITRDILEKTYNCTSELSNLANLIAINIPLNEDYGVIKKYLQNGEDSEKWQYEEGCLSDEHRALIL
jgi:hypothetical protein